MPRILVLQHTPFETLGTIEDALAGVKMVAHYIQSYAGEPVPLQMGSAAGLILMGGPQSVYQQGEFPYLRDEINLIDDALRAGKPVLGVCLGTQLMAAALGAPVTRGSKKELGWHTLRLTDAAAEDLLFKGVNRSFMGFHWHGDIFGPPKGAVTLASSDVTEFQAFRYGQNAYGFLFHMEVTKPIIKEMVENFPEELKAAGLNGRQVLADTEKHFSTLQGIGKTVFERWTKLLT